MCSSSNVMTNASCAYTRILPQVSSQLYCLLLAALVMAKASVNHKVALAQYTIDGAVIFKWMGMIKQFIDTRVCARLSVT